MLQTRPDGACGFLSERGCTVHPDRPLACRIYPLARWTDPEGRESFGHLEPHPQTAGVYGDTGTVGDYLEAQGLAPYFAMSDRYGVVYERMAALLESVAPKESEQRYERRAEMDEMDAGALASSFFDVDATVAAYCGERGLAVPTEADALVDLHILAITAWLDQFEARSASVRQSEGTEG